jgi:hypothetical protein
MSKYGRRRRAAPLYGLIGLLMHKLIHHVWQVEASGLFIRVNPIIGSIGV